MPGKIFEIILKVLAWAFSVVVIFGAVIGFATGAEFLQNLCCLFVGLCAFPPLWGLVQKQGWKAPVWSRWIAAFVFMMLGSLTASKAPMVTSADSAANASAEALRAALTPEQKTASAKALFVKIKAIGGKCEGYGRNLAAGQKLNLTKTRQQFSEGRAACTEAAAELRKIGVPDYVVSQERREDMQTALEEIADAYAAKSDAFARFGDDSDIDDAITVVAPAVQRAHADLSSALREVKILSYDEGVAAAAFSK